MQVIFDEWEREEQEEKMKLEQQQSIDNITGDKTEKDFGETEYIF